MKNDEIKAGDDHERHGLPSGASPPASGEAAENDRAFSAKLKTRFIRRLGNARLRSFKSRITVAFTLIFLACSIPLFLFAYLITSQSLENEERALLRSRLLEFWAVYQTGNVVLLRTELTLERIYSYDRPFTLRVADPLNVTRFIYPAPGQADFPYASLETLPRLDDGEVFTLRNPDNGLELTVAALRLPDNNVLEIGISNTEKLRTLARFRSAFLLVLVPLAFLSVLGGLFFSSRFLSPVKKMAAGIREIIATGDIRTRVPPPEGGAAGDELGELVRHFNDLLARIESLVGHMRDTLDNVAHDVRTPLTRLRAAAEDALAAGDEAALRDALAVCQSESEQVLGLLAALLELSRARSGILSLEKIPVDLSALLQDMAELYSYPAGEKKIEVVADTGGLSAETGGLSAETGGPLTVPADPNRLRQALSNLIENALRHSPAGSRVTLAVRDADGAAEVSVRDEGDGIPPDDLPNIWERFYRGRNAAGTTGFGLGLSMAKAIVEAHGGAIRAESEPGRGATFTLRLPK